MKTIDTYTEVMNILDNVINEDKFKYNFSNPNHSSLFKLAMSNELRNLLEKEEVSVEDDDILITEDNLVLEFQIYSLDQQYRGQYPGG